MVNGRYISKNDDDGNYLNRYEIILNVKVTGKSYIFQLEKLESRYSAGHMKMMFDKTDRCILNRDKPSRHAIRNISDDCFVIYPFQAGFPYVFDLIRDKK